MLLSEEITLPCGLRLPNRLCKAAMAETMSSHHNPDQKVDKAYSEWADGGWGMILTGNVQVTETYLGTPDDIAILSPTKTSKAIQKAWKSYAQACQAHGTPTVVQLCHPGRQSSMGAGNRRIWAKNVAPSAVKMDFGPSLIEKLAVSLVFGTPRELTLEEISGDGGVIDQFVVAAKHCFEAGFKGVELHGAHGYLLAQFMSPDSNRRTDEFGGSPAKRVEVVLRIIRAVREATSKEFCIGIKMNSVDASSSGSLSDTLEQIKLITECGIDFIEISGGTYENPKMMAEPTDNATPSSASSEDDKAAKTSTSQRESFFLEFASTIRETFPSLLLMVTGGFRTRVGMEAALNSRACDLIGVGRPAAVIPKLPKEIILNTAEVPDEQAQVVLERLHVPFLLRLLPVKQIGAGYQSIYYASQIKRMGDGLVPVDSRVKASG